MAAPPPPPSPTMWHYQVGAQQLGPIPFQSLVPMIQNGTITSATLVWREGMAQWAPAGATPELATMFNRSQNVTIGVGNQGALGLNMNGLIVFIILLLVCLPLCWLPWVISSLRADS
jgi:hypothetical protein